MNIYNNSFLDMEFDKKFDIVVMNPPYNQTIDLKFVEKSTLISDKAICVHPSTWLIDEKNKQKKFLKTKSLVKDGLVSVRLFNGNGVFGINLFVPCVVTYFDFNNGNRGEIAMKDEINNNEVVYSDIMDINKYNTVEYQSIKNKLLKNSDTINLHLKDNEKTYWVNLAQISGNHSKDGKIQKDDFYILITKSKGIESCNHDKKNEFSFKTKLEAENFLSYVKTKFVRFCLSIYKNNANCHRGEINLIPWLDFSQEWTDEKLREEFNITDKEWEFIESVIPSYY